MSTLTERLRELGEEWKALAAAQSSPAQRTLWEAADDLLTILEAEHPDDNDDPCDEELHSWDHFRPAQVDSYWMRCCRVGSHDEHENSETGATWTTSPAPTPNADETGASA